MRSQSLWIGSYANPGQPGLVRCFFSPEEGFGGKTEYRGLLNPSFLLEHPAHPVLYTAEETEEGAVCAWRQEEGRLTLLNRLPSGGASPCHLSLSEDGNWLYCANYTGGSAACFRLDGNGIPAERTDLAQHTGKGPNARRQEKAHAHCVYPWRGRIGVCDLGEDRVYLYGNEEGRLAEKACLFTPPGSGPRHLAAHSRYPGCLFCVSELSGEVFIWKETAPGRFELLQGIAAVPRGYAGENTAAAIRFTEDGRWLLVSHRGADGIAAMRMRPDGTAEDPVWSPCVRGPRDFLLCGEFVLAGSQRDGEVRAYRLREGKLQDTGFRLEAREPVCIQKALR